jgi:2-oxoglutarate dehydrogenase complex dehydrogenase (E1) component-like enzyme
MTFWPSATNDDWKRRYKVATKNISSKKHNFLKVAIVRMEQLSPFPYDSLIEECNKYKSADVIWAQEEHKNMGAWTFIQPRFLSFLKLFVLIFVICSLTIQCYLAKIVA